MRIVDESDHEKNRQLRSATYRNLRRFKLTDSELLMELIPYAEGLFCPSEEDYVPLVILPETSMKGSDQPLCVGVLNDDKDTFGAIIGISMKQFGTDRAGLVTEAWGLPSEIEKPLGMAIKNHPMRQELYVLHLFNRRSNAIGATWVIERKNNVRTLAEPDVCLTGCKTRWDQEIQDAWEGFVA